MPDPDRGPGGRWQSDAYRHNARDTRFAYRWNPDRFEDRAREAYERGYEHGYYDRGRDYERGFSSGFDRDDRATDFPRRGGYYYEGEMGPGRFDEYDRGRDRDRWRRG